MEDANLYYQEEDNSVVDQDNIILDEVMNSQSTRVGGLQYKNSNDEDV